MTSAYMHLKIYPGDLTKYQNNPSSNPSNYSMNVDERDLCRCVFVHHIFVIFGSTVG